MDMSQEVIAFDSNTSGWSSGMKSGQDATMHVAETSDTNDGFLGRPVKIWTQPWEIGENLHITFDPWSLFFNNSKVVNRVAHFKNLRATLHVKFQLNGSPFYYGRLMCSYNPLPNSDNYTQDRSTVPQDRIAASQRPKIFLDPTTNEGGEIVCPFIWPKNYVDIPSAEWSKMGNITVFTLNGLAHANDVTETVTLTAYAYCSDYTLNTPTSQLPSTIVPQMDSVDNDPSKDGKSEYGMISGPAHTLANWSGMLKKMPYIGKYARATEIVSSSVGNIAQLFGFSKPRALDQTRKNVFGGVELSVADVPDNSMSLGYSATKEVTVDPTVTGAAPLDEMAIVPLACHESYLTQFPWSVSDPSDKLLFNMRVRPTQGDIAINGLDGEVHMTPSSWVSLPFEYWKGSFEVRLQIVCSAYHRGRLRVVWDPDYYEGGDYNVNYSKIVDIHNAKEMKFRFGWGANTSYLPVSDPISGPTDQTLFPSFSLEQYTTKENFSNGVISVFVVNELTSPSASGNDIGINVFTNMADDFEVNGPTCAYIENFVAYDEGTDYISDPTNPRNPGGNPPPDVGPVDVPTPDNDFNQDADLIFKQVNPFGVLQINPADVQQGAARPFDSPNYSDQVGVATDRAFLLSEGTTNLILYGRGNPDGFSGTSTFTFTNPSTNNRAITITYLAQNYVASLPAFIGASVSIDVPIGFTSPLNDWQTNPLSITVTGSGGRIRLDEVGTALKTTEDVTNYSNVNIVANSPQFSLVSGKATNNTGGPAAAIVAPTGVELGSPGTWISTTPMNVDGIDYDNDLSPSDTNAVPIPFTWNAGGTFPVVIPGTALDVPPVDVLDFYTVINTNPECDIVPEMDGVDDPMDEPEANAPEIETPTCYMGPDCVAGPANQVYFGEQIASIRQILKRATGVYTLVGNGTEGGPAELILPQYPLVTADFSIPSLEVQQIGFTTHSWFSSAYVCERGSYRIKLLAAPSGGGGPQINVAYATRIPSTSNEVPGVSKTFNMDINHCGSAHGYPNLNGNFEVEIPWYSNYRFLHSRNTDVRNEEENIERGLVKIGFGHSTFVRATITYSAGEDYALTNFLSVPVFFFLNE